MDDTERIRDFFLSEMNLSSVANLMNQYDWHYQCKSATVDTLRDVVTGLVEKCMQAPGHLHSTGGFYASFDGERIQMDFRRIVAETGSGFDGVKPHHSSDVIQPWMIEKLCENVLPDGSNFDETLEVGGKTYIVQRIDDGTEIYNYVSERIRYVTYNV